MIKIFLSGGMNQDNWQLKVIEKCSNNNFIFFNPREHNLSDSKQYTFWDLFQIDQADLVFAYLEKDNPSGFGLTFEVGYAKALGKKIILVDEKSSHDRDFASRFLIVRESSTIVFDDFELGLNFLSKMENGVSKPNFN